MCFFLPLGCLKAITTIGALLSIIISFGLLGITIYANMEKKQIIDRASEGLVNGALVALYILSIIFLLLGIAGLYGSLKGGKNNKKGNPCLLALYSLGILVFFALFLGATIFFFVGPQAIFGMDCKNGSKTTLINDLYIFSNEVSTQYFCKDKCQCYVKNTTDYDYLANSLTANGFLNVTRDDSKQATQYQACGQQDTAQEQNMLLMASLEQLLGCAGWCPSPIEKFRYYRFRNINDCYTKDCLANLQACHTSFEDFMNAKGNIVGFGCLIACLICFLNVVTVCCIFCHPTKSGSKKNFYSRMNMNMSDD